MNNINFRKILIILFIVLILYYIYNKWAINIYHPIYKFNYNNKNNILKQKDNSKNIRTNQSNFSDKNIINYQKNRCIELSKNNINKLKKSFKNSFERDIGLYYENFNNNMYTIKLYYADWCPHCTNFKPKWFDLKIKYKNINFIEVDCTNNSPDVDYVKGFPTISIYKNNKFIEVFKDNRHNFESYIKGLN